MRAHRSIVLLLCALLGAGLALGCGSEAAPAAAALPVAHVEDGPHDAAVLEMGELGQIRIELLPELAPQTVARFVERSRAGLYDGTTFHRVIPGFMIQGGNPLTLDKDPRNDARDTEDPTVPDEFTDYPQVRGTVSFANTGARNSGKVQFFILQQDQRQLDGHYTAFGHVVEGMDVVDAITALEIDRYGRYGPPDRPYPVDARIEHVRIESADGKVLAPLGANG